LARTQAQSLALQADLAAWTAENEARGMKIDPQMHVSDLSDMHQIDVSLGYAAPWLPAGHFAVDRLQRGKGPSALLTWHSTSIAVSTIVIGFLAFCASQIVSGVRAATGLVSMLPFVTVRGGRAPQLRRMHLLQEHNDGRDESKFGLNSSSIPGAGHWKRSPPKRHDLRHLGAHVRSLMKEIITDPSRLGSLGVDASLSYVGFSQDDQDTLKEIFARGWEGADVPFDARSSASLNATASSDPMESSNMRWRGQSGSRNPAAVPNADSLGDRRAEISSVSTEQGTTNAIMQTLLGSNANEGNTSPFRIKHDHYAEQARKILHLRSGMEDIGAVSSGARINSIMDMLRPRPNGERTGKLELLLRVPLRVRNLAEFSHSIGHVAARVDACEPKAMFHDRVEAWVQRSKCAAAIKFLSKAFRTFRQWSPKMGGFLDDLQIGTRQCIDYIAQDW